MQPRLLSSLSRAEKFDILNPQNDLSKISLQQKLLGNASKVDFSIKPQVRKANLIQMASSKQPAQNKKCNHIKKVLDDFKEELYKQEKIVAGQFERGHRKNKSMFSTNQSSKLNYMATSLQSSGADSRIPQSYTRPGVATSMLRTEMSIKDRLQMYKSQRPPGPKMEAKNAFESRPQRRQAIMSRLDQYAQSTLGSQRPSILHALEQEQLSAFIPAGTHQDRHGQQRMRTLQAATMLENPWKFPSIEDRGADGQVKQQTAMNAYDQSERIRITDQLLQEPERSTLQQQLLDNQIISQMSKPVPRAKGQQTLPRVSPLIATKLLKTMLGADSRQQENSRTARKSFTSEMEQMPDRSKEKGSNNSTGPTIVPQPARDSGDESYPQEKLAQRLSPLSAKESRQSRTIQPAQDSFAHRQTSRGPKNPSSEQTFNAVMDPKLDPSMSFRRSNAGLQAKPATLTHGKSKHALEAKNRKQQTHKNAAEDKAFAQFQRLMIKYSDADNESPRGGFQLNAQKKQRGDASQRQSGRRNDLGANRSLSDDNRSDPRRSEQSGQKLSPALGQGNLAVRTMRAADIQRATVGPSPLPSSKRESLVRLERGSPGSVRSAGSDGKHQREPRRSKLSQGSAGSIEFKRRKQRGAGEDSKFSPLNEEQNKSVEQRSFLLNTDSNSRRGPSESRLQPLEPTIPRLLRKTGTNDLATPGPQSSDLNGANSPDGGTQLDNRERNPMLGTTQTVDADAGKTEQRSQSRLFPFISSKRHSKQRSLDNNDPFRSTKTRVRHPNTKESSLRFHGNLSPSSGSVEDVLRADGPAKVSLPPASQQRMTLPGQGELDQAQRARQGLFRGGRTYQQNKINPKLIEMKQKERQQMRQNQTVANNEKVFHQSAYSTFKLDLSDPNTGRFRRDGRHSVLGALQYSPILPMMNLAARTMVGPAAPQPPWGASAESSARASFHMKQHVQLQQRADKHQKKSRATNLQVRGETMHMSSLRDWCKNQQDMYDQTKQNADGDSQAWLGAALGMVQANGELAGFREGQGEPGFPLGMPRHGEYAGSGTLQYSHRENEERSFNVGTYQLNSKSDLHTSRRRLNEIVEIQLRNPPRKEKRDTQNIVSALQEELNAQSSNDDSPPTSPDAKGLDQLRKLASDLESSPSYNDTAGARVEETLITKNLDGGETDPRDQEASEMLGQAPQVVAPPHQGSTATFRIEQWERTSMEKKNSLADHLGTKEGSQEPTGKANSSKVLKEVHKPKHKRRKASNPTILSPQEIQINHNLQSLFQHLAAQLALSPLSEYGRFPIADPSLQNTKYFRNFQRQLQIQQQQLQRQNLSKINLQFNGKETQTIEQKHSKHIYKLQVKHNLLEPPTQRSGPSSLPRSFGFPSPVNFNDSWHCFEALQPRTMAYNQDVDMWSDVNGERKPSMKDLTFGEHQPLLGGANRSARKGGAYGWPEYQGSPTAVPSFLPSTTKWSLAKDLRPSVNHEEHSEGGSTPIQKQSGRRAAKTNRNSKTVVSSNKDPKIRMFGPGGLDHAVQGTLFDYSKSLRSNSHAVDSTQNLQSLTRLQSIQKLQDLHSMHSMHSQNALRAKDEQAATHDGRGERLPTDTAQRSNVVTLGDESVLKQGPLEQRGSGDQQKLLNVVNLQLSVESGGDSHRHTGNIPTSPGGKDRGPHPAYRQDDLRGQRRLASPKAQGAGKKSPSQTERGQAAQRSSEQDVGYVIVARKAPFGNAQGPQSPYDLLFQVEGRSQGGAPDAIADPGSQPAHDGGSGPAPTMKKNQSHQHPGAQFPLESLIQFTEHSALPNQHDENEELKALVGDLSTHPEDRTKRRGRKPDEIRSGQEVLVLDPQASRNEAFVLQANDASGNLAQTLRRESLPQLQPALVPGDVQVVKSTVAGRAPSGLGIQPSNPNAGHRRDSLTFSPIKNPSLKKGRITGVEKPPFGTHAANQTGQLQRAGAANKSPVRKGARQLDHASSTRTLRQPSKLSHLTEREEPAQVIQYRQSKPVNHHHQRVQKQRNVATGLGAKQQLNQDLPPQPIPPHLGRGPLSSRRPSQKEPPYGPRSTYLQAGIGK